tara:strand:- start:4908 stop:5135 length:228 start_codon:yes stop_codon:yes gene_type:complete
VICIGEIECGDEVGQTVGTSIQIGNGVGMLAIITIGVPGLNILGTVIGIQVIGIGISGIILGKTIHMYMDQELVG